MLLGSTVLEVAIGLLFVYLLLSLLCSAVTEYIEVKLNKRAEFLRKGIELLLNDTSGKGLDLASQLYAHGLVRPFYRDGNRLPSYIPSRTFALALWNLATTAAAAGRTNGTANDVAGVTTDLGAIRDAVARHLPNEELRTALVTLIDEAQGDIEKARHNIETWYEAMMDRVSGWYKRRTAALALGLGVAMAAVLNADTITIANALARDSALRAAVVSAAQREMDSNRQSSVPPIDQAAASPAATAGQPPADPTSKTTTTRTEADRLRTTYGDVAGLGLPIGWSRRAPAADPRAVPGVVGDWILKLLGILITGFAISQGAPFWFDVLNKFMVVRSTVKPTEKSQEQPSKDRPMTDRHAMQDTGSKEETPKG